MAHFKSFAVSLMLLSCLVATAKDKKKIALPADILQARTVLVVVDPDAGMAIQDPNANRAARDDVEKALIQWGRFTEAQDASNADLIITVRKGNGKIAQPTIGGIPTNNRPVVLQPTDSGGRVGGRVGNPPNIGDPPSTQTPVEGPHPQAEVGAALDMFAVYRGGRDAPLDYSAVWRYTAKNALRSPDVPAVEEFKKVIAEAEKELAAQP